ncbi:hypothetical protein H4R18_001270 [Coemansia javaensis]|uniref:PH domain-containing protein n=1 Tax=Coemansia javaensis TaxID=2761396 RepID=A0A9W8HFR1_9FUNG|nr:hypothetical protein H4R18_001270 [Coemansia javaensis]
MGLPSVAAVAGAFDTFRQKLYLQGVLGKKNDRAGDGRPYSMRKWTRWYVELRGPVLVFWNLLDPQLAAYLEDITAIVDGRVQPGSAEFERTVAHIKNIVFKPNFINITDAACSIVGKLKKRDSVWTLHSSGANRFYMQAVDDRAMNAWVRALRLACFEAAKLYEYYSAALVAERYAAVLAPAAPRARSYRVQARFSGTNDWVPCDMELSAAPAQVAFHSQQPGRARLATLTSPRSAYAIYPDSLDSVATAVIAKLEGDCDVDASLHPKIDDDGDDDDPEAAAGGPAAAAAEPPVATLRAHGSYALVIFQTPDDMAAALIETAAHARLYRMPTAFAPDVVPDPRSLYLSPADIADKSIEIMEPVTARRMLDNVAAERCAPLDMADHASPDYSTSGSAAAAPAAAADSEATRMPWDSDESADELAAAPAAAAAAARANGNGHGHAKQQSHRPRPADDHEGDTETEAQPQKRHFRFLHKAGKAKAGSPARSSASSLKDSVASSMKHLKRQSKAAATSPTAGAGAGASSANTSTVSRNSLRNSASDKSGSHASMVPSLPTPALDAVSRGTFGDDAAEAIVNLKIVESPPPATAAAARGALVAEPEPLRQLAESDTDSDGDEPLGDIVSRNAQNNATNNMAAAARNGGAPRQQQQQQQQQQQMPPVSMYRASTAMPAFGVPQQQQQQQLLQPNMMMSAPQHTQSIYGTVPGMTQQQQQQQQMMMQQQMLMQQQQMQQMYPHDPTQMVGPSGMSMPFQAPGQVRGRPTTYMDAGPAWAQQPGMMGMGVGMGVGMGMGMDSGSGPLLTMDKKADPIERPTGLVGAIATREQMKSEQKYRDSSSLMKERQIRRNQAMGIANPNPMMAPGGGAGARFGANVHSMYGAPQAWAGAGAADDTMSMISGMSGRAPYAQMAPSLSAEQIVGPHMRGSVYGSVPMAPVGMMAPMAAGGSQTDMGGLYGGVDNDDMALSAYAAGRMSMAGAPDVHPLRAAMQSGMSASSPHLSGLANNPYGQQMQQQMQMQQQQQQQMQMQMQQQLQMQQQQLQMQMQHQFGLDQQRRMSAVGMPGMQRASVANQPISPGAIPVGGLPSRYSMASSHSGSGGSSSGSSPLAMQHHRAPANRWVKESSSLRVQSNLRSGGDARSSTVPRHHHHHDAGGKTSKARATVTSVYELPGRAAASRPSAVGTGYSSQSDAEDSGSGSESESEAGARGAAKVPRELKQFFDVFVDKCLDVKPYAWLDFDAAFAAYANFCNRNGMRGKNVASSAQFESLMEGAEWQLKTKRNGVRAYYNAYLLQ